MLGTVCLLVLGILSVRSELSWDIAVTTAKQFELYKNDIKVYSGVDQFEGLTAIAYDAVHNKLLFVDSQDDNASIFSYHLTTKKQEVLVKSTFNVKIDGLAFDPVKGILFWTDTIKRSIYWMSMETGSKDDHYGTLLIQMTDDKMPTAIAVDSCNGYLYWTSTNLMQYTIERTRFDGTEFEQIAYANGACLSLAIDQETKKIYWGEVRNNNQYSIESADFNGKNRRTLVVDTYYNPIALTVSKDSIYWVNSGDVGIWKLSKNPAKDEKPIKYMELDDDAIGIAAYYAVEEQINDQDLECVALTKLSQYNSAIQNYADDDDTEADLFCVYGTKINGLSLCECMYGYIGWRCDVSVCYNYCLHGHCFFEDGEPKCSCEAGYKGTRCEMDMCEGYCLNDGSCIPIEGSEPGCLCVEGYEGSRCEVSNSPVEIVQVLAPLCTCNGKQNYNKSLHRSRTIFTMDNFIYIIRNTLQGVSVIFYPKVAVMGLCMVCGMLLGMTIQYRMHLRSSKARNKAAVYQLPPMPMPMDWRNQKKILDDKSINISM